MFSCRSIVGISTLCLAVAGSTGCAPVRQPPQMVGTWQAEHGVTLTFSEDGNLSTRGEGTVPTLFADLLHSKYWEWRHGNLYAFENGPDDESPRFESPCTWEDDGKVLAIGAFKLTRK